MELYKIPKVLHSSFCAKVVKNMRNKKNIERNSMFFFTIRSFLNVVLQDETNVHLVKNTIMVIGTIARYINKSPLESPPFLRLATIIQTLTLDLSRSVKPLL